MTVAVEAFLEEFRLPEPHQHPLNHDQLTQDGADKRFLTDFAEWLVDTHHLRWILLEPEALVEQFYAEARKQ